jgi:hypothetical protein
MTALGDDVLVTALRAGNGNLLLISWRLEPDGTISRLGDSGSQAGEVSLVTVAAVDGSNVVTAVRNGSGNLELIGWGIASSGSIQRWGDSGEQAGEVGEIAIASMLSGGPTEDLVTAVQSGSGNLLLITWRPSPGAGSIQRLADSGGQAGTASDISICSTDTSSGPMRRGSGNLELIAFDVVGDGPGSVMIRTGDYSNEANADVTETALLTLDPGRILNAMRITRGCEQPDNHLLLTTYSLSGVAATLIRPIAEGSAGKASRIAVQAFGDSEVLTALRNDSGDLELIGWRTAPGDAAITRGADSGTQAGTANEVALALIGRRAITAVRSGSDRLLLISWDVPPGLGREHRPDRRRGAHGHRSTPRSSGHPRSGDPDVDGATNWPSPSALGLLKSWPPISEYVRLSPATRESWPPER